MSELKKIREEKNLTQEELAEKSGLSVRTIQRIEAGTAPKGYTLKTLASALDISEKDLSVSSIAREEIKTEEPILPIEYHELINHTLIKIINLSSLPLCWFPVANFLPPVLLMYFTKERSPIVKQIISLQIILAVILPIILMIVILLKLGKTSVMMTMVLLVLANVYVILRNAYQIDKDGSLHYKLNFSVI
ncbi:helix-turn-helix domain-containing protein [Epilithonimonas tenax]|uniref:helix-turn-helix domain-containing protein n=1 Tax=Epilithonimonas tenax TaxID=191577 RepID=UPI00040FDF84|nr:helix-turn-helix domain-containing protein [Epilithonimonas tenax]